MELWLWAVVGGLAGTVLMDLWTERTFARIKTVDPEKLL